MKSKVDLKSVEARRYGMASQPGNINNNSTLTTVSGEADTLTISFVFSSNYEPNIGIIRIEGELEMKDEEELVKNAVDEWKSSGRKNLPKEIAEKVHNAILSNCVIEASILARDINLPTPIPVPHVQLPKDSNIDTSYIR
ncbi:hypothetical protein ACFLRF_02670 [Candidatus Altiarchaeota archaeon]